MCSRSVLPDSEKSLSTFSLLEVKELQNVFHKTNKQNLVDIRFIHVACRGRIARLFLLQLCLRTAHLLTFVLTVL